MSTPTKSLVDRMWCTTPIPMELTEGIREEVVSDLIGLMKLYQLMVLELDQLDPCLDQCRLQTHESFYSLHHSRFNRSTLQKSPDIVPDDVVPVSTTPWKQVPVMHVRGGTRLNLKALPQRMIVEWLLNAIEDVVDLEECNFFSKQNLKGLVENPYELSEVGFRKTVLNTYHITDIFMPTPASLMAESAGVSTQEGLETVSLSLRIDPATKDLSVVFGFHHLEYSSPLLPLIMYCINQVHRHVADWRSGCYLWSALPETSEALKQTLLMNRLEECEQLVMAVRDCWDNTDRPKATDPNHAKFLNFQRNDIRRKMRKRFSQRFAEVMSEHPYVNGKAMINQIDRDWVELRKQVFIPDSGTAWLLDWDQK